MRCCLGLVVIVLGLVACAPEQQPLPTLIPTADPRQPDIPLPPIPATNTPLADLVAAAQPGPADPDSALPATFLPPPLATLTATPSPTPTAEQLAETMAGSPPDDAPVRTGPPRLVACDGTGYVYRGQFPSPAGSRSYRAYLPPCYGHDGRVYPVLYLFHGSVQTSSHWLDLGLVGQMDAAIGDGRFPPFIVILPDNGSLGNNTSGGPNSIEGVVVSGLLPYVDANFCSWAAAAGRGIGGISRGGYWALEIAFRYPGLFRSVAGHSSHLRFETDGPTYNPLATYPNAAGLRIWLDWGEDDFLRSGQEQLRNSLAEVGIPHEARVNSGGHSDSYWRAYLPTYLAWHAAAWPTSRDSYGQCGLVE